MGRKFYCLKRKFYCIGRARTKMYCKIKFYCMREMLNFFCKNDLGLVWEVTLFHNHHTTKRKKL